MTPQQYLDAITKDSEQIAAQATGRLNDRIDFLEGWDMRALVSHLGGVYAYASANAAQPVSEIQSPGPEAKAPDADDAILDWFHERRGTLLRHLTDMDLAAPSASHAGTHAAGWWQRRMAHETAVHRWDADAAIEGIAAATAIDSDLATDGVNEFIEVTLRDSADRVHIDGSLHLHRSDGHGEWMLVANARGGVTATHEHGKGDAAVRGPASALMLWMWGRPVSSDVEIFGDKAVADAWRSLG